MPVLHMWAACHWEVAERELGQRWPSFLGALFPHRYKNGVAIFHFHTTFKKLSNLTTPNMSSLSLLFPSISSTGWWQRPPVSDPPSYTDKKKFFFWEPQYLCYMLGLVTIQLENINSYFLKKVEERAGFCTSQLQFCQILKYHYSINKQKLWPEAADVN